VWVNSHFKAEVEVGVMLRPTVSRPGYLGVGHPSGAHDQIFIFCLCGFLEVELPLHRENGPVTCSYSFFWALPVQSLSGPGLRLGVSGPEFHKSLE
jgi:hypothetical protein